MTSLDEFNGLAEDAATQALLDCCSSGRWADAMAAARPYQSIEALLTESDRAVAAMGEPDLRAALAGHPRLGDLSLASGDRPGSAGGQSGAAQPAADGRSAVLGVAQPAGPAGLLPAARSAPGAGWSRQEQAGVSTADAATLEALADGNAAYEERFGHIYLVCASGRSGAELLALLRGRLGNDRETEWRVMAGELAKINQIRLRKLVAGLADRADPP